jgi:glycosyltransferase involved in cell wall biosynthesis
MNRNHQVTFVPSERVRLSSPTGTAGTKKRSKTQIFAQLLKRLTQRLKVKHKGVLFIGYAEAALGLGVSFRSMLTALEKASLPFAIYPFNANVETRRIGSFLEHKYDITGCYEINVAYMAVDQLPVLREKLHYQMTQARYNILRTYWELPQVPQEWAYLLENIDELWAPNAFVAQAFRAIYKGNISIIPVSVDVSRSKVYDRSQFNMSCDTFYFLFSFDYFSGAARKNPFGVVQAFAKAFPEDRQNVGLLIKSVGPTQLDASVSQLLTGAASNDRRIRVLHMEMERDEMLSLIEQSDCYISLHRSEGFGMGMAEALAFGKPVIGTDFSGNREFLTTRTGFPVSYTIRQLLPGEYPGGDNQYWAEPDLEIAAEQMQRVFSDREESARRRFEGKKLIESRYAGEKVAELIKARLVEIRNSIDSR